jgi:hypothetical protein
MKLIHNKSCYNFIYIRNSDNGNSNFKIISKLTDKFRSYYSVLLGSINRYADILLLFTDIISAPTTSLREDGQRPYLIQTERKD